MDTNVASSIPEVTTAPIVSGDGDGVSAKDLLLVFGAIALGLFVTGSIMFNIANYKAIKNVKKKYEQLEKSESAIV